ncbi:MAG: HDIG domain-containing protein [Muribaculaceae bacterium]|nr:HDIG domain-containing protein [Muribaculaceae bacterium]
MKIDISRITLLRAATFVVATLLAVLFLPGNDEQRFNYEENRPWTHSLLTAPFDIPVFRDSTTVREMSDSIRAGFIPVYKRQTQIADNVKQRISELTEIPQNERARLRTLVDRLYAGGIVDSGTAGQISSGKLKSIKIVSDNIIQTGSTSSFRSQRSAYALLDSLAPSAEARQAILAHDIPSLLLPNMVLDTIESERLLQEALQPATAAIGVVQQGERIVDRGDIVTPQLYQVLLTYEDMVEARDLSESSTHIYIEVGQIMYIAILFAAVYLYFFLYRPKWWGNRRRLLCVMTLLTAFYIFAVILSAAFTSGIYIIPFTILPIMMVVFYDARTALFVHLIEILLCINLSTFPVEFVFIEFIAGIASIFSLQELSKRSQLIKTAAYVFLSYTVAYLAVELMTTGIATSFSWKLIGFFMINAVLTSFAYILIFLLEKAFGFISVVTLVELADINSPILRELSEECPGTFQHSIAVSSLAAEAARKIHANVQIVRAGALYHDIGKISNPAFFTENQHGVNPHDSLTPEQSARIIIGHITDGLKRADKAQLPEVIRDMIRQHHGAGKAKYFYITECRRKGEENVDPELYTYPGPNPQTAEASLLMMADSVEAASRSLPSPTVEASTELVNRIIDSQINEGLHNDSPISFRDIKEIKESFIKRLRTIYHARIAYPSDESTRRQTPTANQP